MKKYQVIIPADINPYPEKHEVSAAGLLANYFKGNVEFIPRSSQKTPDFRMNDVEWELKSPTGSGKRNIQHQFYHALKQSKNIVFDARRSKIHITKIRSEVTRQFCMAKTIKRLIIIDKLGNISELTKQ